MRDTMHIQSMLHARTGPAPTPNRLIGNDAFTGFHAHLRSRGLLSSHARLPIGRHRMACVFDLTPAVRRRSLSLSLRPRDHLLLYHSACLR